MLGRAGSWSRVSGGGSGGLLNTRFWFYQDFAAGTGSTTLTGNSNGTGGATWDSANIITNSVVITDTDGNPIFSNSAALPSQLVSATNSGASVTMSATPDVSFGTVRIWYLYQVSASSAPEQMTIAPSFVVKSRAEFMDSRFLNAALNLSDITNAGTARTNLGFTTQTAGRVLLGDGGTTFTSDADLFYDTTNNYLGVNLGATAPQFNLDVKGVIRSTTSFLVTNFTGGGYRAQLAIASGAFDYNGFLQLTDEFNSINVRLNSGPTQTAYFTNGVSLAVGTTAATSGSKLTVTGGAIDAGIAGTSTGSIRLSGSTSGQITIQGQNAAGTYNFNLPTSAGSSGQPLLSGGGGGTAMSFGTLGAGGGGTGLTAVGTANQLFGTNNAANAFEHKAATLTAAGTLTIPSGQIISLPAGSVSAASLAFTGSLGTGLYSPTTDQVAVAAGGVQLLLATATLLTAPLATLFKASIQLEDPGAGTNTVTIQSGTVSSSYTITLPTAQATVSNSGLVNNGSGTLSWAKVPLFKAGSATISSGVRNKAITFATDFGSTAYSIQAFIVNTTDTAPLKMGIIGISKASTGFTIEFSDLTDTANYILDWSITGHYDP